MDGLNFTLQVSDVFSVTIVSPHSGALDVRSTKSGRSALSFIGNEIASLRGNSNMTSECGAIPGEISSQGYVMVVTASDSCSNHNVD
jgi:hypothetical protein